MARTAKPITINDTTAKQESGTIDTNIVKRRPGRPRKSTTNSTSTSTSSTSSTRNETTNDQKDTYNSRLHSANFQVENVFTEPTEEAEPLSFIDNISAMESPKKRGGRTSKSDKAFTAASELVTIANILAVSVAGPDAGMNMVEEPLITASLARTLEKNNNAEKLEEKFTPFALVIGLTIWSIRVGKTIYDNNKDRVQKMIEKRPIKQEQNRTKSVAPDKVEIPITEHTNNGYVGEGTILKSMLEFDANL